MKRLFGHVIVRTTHCLSCGYQSKVPSPFEYRLGVALDRGSTIEELLRLHTFAPVHIKEYRCDQCKKKCKARQLSVLRDMPAILQIEFLRFKQQGFGSYVKNPKAVTFEQTLQMSEYSEQGHHLRYSLLAVVQHIGSFQGGHYRCVAKNPAGNWEVLDDESVHTAPVTAALRPKDGWTPYTLYYAQT